ncbi:unnamed protein product [Sympodiomycopsis kandeliae]
MIKQCIPIEWLSRTYTLALSSLTDKILEHKGFTCSPPCQARLGQEVVRAIATGEAQIEGDGKEEDLDLRWNTRSESVTSTTRFDELQPHIPSASCISEEGTPTDGQCRDAVVGKNGIFLAITNRGSHLGAAAYDASNARVMLLEDAPSQGMNLGYEDALLQKESLNQSQDDEGSEYGLSANTFATRHEVLSMRKQAVRLKG